MGACPATPTKEGNLRLRPQQAHTGEHAPLQGGLVDDDGVLHVVLRVGDDGHDGVGGDGVGVHLCPGEGMPQPDFRMGALLQSLQYAFFKKESKRAQQRWDGAARFAWHVSDKGTPQPQYCSVWTRGICGVRSSYTLLSNLWPGGGPTSQTLHSKFEH